jgi:hypothetical protein
MDPLDGRVTREKVQRVIGVFVGSNPPRHGAEAPKQATRDIASGPHFRSSSRVSSLSCL